MPSSPILAAVVGVVGTLAGGTLSAVVSVWNTKNTRRRDAELEAQRFAQSESVRRRAERVSAYRDWLNCWDDLERSLSSGASDNSAEFAQLDKVAALVQLIGSEGAATAARRCAGIFEQIRTAVTDRPALLAQLADFRKSTQELLRAELG